MFPSTGFSVSSLDFSRGGCWNYISGNQQKKEKKNKEKDNTLHYEQVTTVLLAVIE
jgi:hypothetical protein